MKLRMVLQMQTVVIGLAGVLMLASSLPAQEIVNTSFDDGPNVTLIAQATAAPVASDLGSSTEEPEAAISAAMISEPVVVREGGITLWTSLEGWLITGFLLGIAIVALYALSEAKRANRDLAARLGQVNRRSAVS
jgi:hypothetical protein